MSTPISITAISSLSSLGSSYEGIWNNYQGENHCLVKKRFGDNDEWVAVLAGAEKKAISDLRHTEAKYAALDDSVLLAILASRKAVMQAGWCVDGAGFETADFGINVGSSRGATTLFEKYHEDFILQKKSAILASPTTTLGNISSWVAHDLHTCGPEISHSITCSTALHALLNGMAWIKSGMAQRFLVGGSEAPLTPFTIAQMKALRIYGQGEGVYPCRAMDLDKRQNTMVLGEGSAMACLEKGEPPNALALIEGVGYATEVLQHTISISADAQCFQRSMKMALGKGSPKKVDAIVMHAPGTIKGDNAEFQAISTVFEGQLPALTTNKWKIGHTFGASGMLSIEFAIMMLQRQKFIKVPFVPYTSIPDKLERILVNAVGFGGNAVSILLKNPANR